jgi:hypothetical protein
MNDDASALDRITKRLKDGRNSAETLDSLHTAQSTLRKTTAADAKLEDIAQTQGLSTIKTVGDGNCLQYAVNEAHKAQTGSYLADNDNLRLLATELARNQIRQLASTRPQEITELEMKETKAVTQNGTYDYPEIYMHALASLRNGPIVILSETLGVSTQFAPLENMTTTIRGPHNPTPAEPRLPPIYILNRTSTDPPRLNFTKRHEQRV